MKKPKKELTLNDLAGSIEDLAAITAKGFNEITNSTNSRFNDVDKGFDAVDKRLKNLEDGQDQIKLRLDNVAYRFELVELQRRVQLLEKRIGVKS